MATDVALPKVQQHKYELLPPEGGWGFLVAFSMSVMFIVTLAPMAAFGIVFGPFLASIGDETSGTTIVNGLFNTVLCFTGLAANQLLQKTSYRKVGLLGASLYFAGSFSTIFVTSLMQMIISFGVLQGLGFGLMMPAIFTAFNHYFDQKKNMVMSIAQAIVVASTIAFPALAKYCLDSYGFRGTVALISALSLNCLPAVATLQPVKWHMKKEIKSAMEMSQVHNMHTIAINGNKEKSAIMEGEPLLEYTRDVENLRKSILTKSQKSLVGVGSVAMSVSSINKLGKEETVSVWQSLSKALDLGLFKDPVYINITCGLSLSITSDLAFLSLVPLLLEGFGFNKQELTLILTIYFVADLVCRILLSVLTALVQVRNRYLFLAGAFFSAIFRIAFVMNHSFWWTVAVSAALGFLRCLIQTPLPLVIAEVYSERFVTAFSLYMVVCGFFALLFGPLTAVVKTLTQSNEMVVHLLTVAYLLCAIPWIIELVYFKITRKSKLDTT